MRIGHRGLVRRKVGAVRSEDLLTELTLLTAEAGQQLMTSLTANKSSAEVVNRVLSSLQLD